MEKLFKWEIEVWGGKFNGYRRNYDNFWKAKTQANRYAQNGKTGQITGDHIYVDIYQICLTDYSKELIETIENV